MVAISRFMCSLSLGITGLLAAAVRSFSQFAVKQGKARLGLFTKIVVGVILPIVAALVFLDLLEFATANRPGGRFLGLGIGMSLSSWLLWAVSDVARWLWALLVLAVLVTDDAHSWPMFPFYKRRLSEAFAIRRKPEGKEVEEVRYEDRPALVVGIDPRKPTGWRWRRNTDSIAKENEVRAVPHDRLFSAEDEALGGRLVMCCAAKPRDCRTCRGARGKPDI